MMKILVLTHEFPPIGGGGGRVAQDICIGLAQRGHALRILTSHLDGLSRNEIIHGMSVERIPLRRKEAFRAEFLEMARYDWSTISVGLKIIREWKPDWIHAHFAVPAGAAAFGLSKLTGVPYLLTVHLGDVPGALPEKTDRWFRWVYPFTPAIWRNAAKVVAVSEFTRKLALTHYQVPITVVPNGVDLKTLPEHQSHSNIPHIVFAGRFVEQKRPEDLVLALSQLKDLPWTCSMLGDGPLLEPVRKTVVHCGLSDRVTLAGWITPEDVLNAFARSDILVLPSRSEGLPVVGVQALGMGLALVLSEAGGNVELVQHEKNGFIFPIGNVDALVTALRALLQNPNMLRSAQKKSLELAKKFDLATVVAQYEHLFEAIDSNVLIQRT